MDRILIRGGNRLNGRIPISGAKNSALTLLPCALLTDEPLTLRNLPRLADVDSFGHLLNQLGCSTMIEGARPEDFGRVMTLRAGKVTATMAPYDIVRKMRASILVLGPLLARAGEATVSLPGGCAIGNRPIDLHLKALEAFGAEIETTAGYVTARAKNGRLPGGTIVFPVVSVGATENALMAAVRSKGTCILENAAREPEIVDLCRLLVAMGAHIDGIGTEKLVVEGVARSLDPHINIWEVARPVVEAYIKDSIGPKAAIRDAIRTMRVLSRFGPKLPKLAEELLSRQGKAEPEPEGPSLWLAASLILLGAAAATAGFILSISVWG